MDGEGSERRADTEALAFRPQVPDLGGGMEQFLINVDFPALRPRVRSDVTRP